MDDFTVGDRDEGSVGSSGLHLYIELWATGHPKGQRICDKVEFALEMLRRHRPDLLRNDRTP